MQTLQENCLKTSTFPLNQIVFTSYVFVENLEL